MDIGVTIRTPNGELVTYYGVMSNFQQDIDQDLIDVSSVGGSMHHVAGTRTVRISLEFILEAWEVGD